MATITKRANGKWQAKCRRNGINQSKTFRLKSDAQKWARQIESAIDKGVFESTHDAESMLMNDVFERYWYEVVREQKSAKSTRSKINHLKKIMGHLRLIDLTVSVIREFKSYRLENVENDTVRKELAFIKRMIKYAMNEWQVHLPRGNPVDPVSFPSKGKPRDRRLFAGEENLLLCNAKNYGGVIHDVIVFAIETGMRRGEIVNSRDAEEIGEHGYSCMCWENFNEVNSTIHLLDTKNGESRTVPLSPKATQVILSQPRKSAGPIFDIRGDSIGQAFRRITKRAGIQGLRFHDLRHEATSRFFEMGLQMMEVSAITGHKDLAMLKRYTHLRPDDIARKLAL
ncbi:tyrosine-type recombinase/integrase [Planctobacterium marinum]|uniref:Integrase n=1 Tax=Planctobacterium marinum TaxID=1631968 RepID=A0AA48HFZ3_9ALTE|nr:integrase [Planctobacterium marinum]